MMVTVRALWALGMVAWYFLALYRMVRSSKWSANGAATALFATMAGGFLLSRYGFHRYDSTVALAGAVGGAFLFLALSRRLALWRELLEAGCWAFAFAWVPVRLGCVLERAHGGAASNSWLAVRFPDGVSRWDLALLEMLWAACTAVLLLVRPGLRAAVAVPASLAVFRLAVNPLRGDPGDAVYLPSVILALWAMFVWLRTRGASVE